jgi:hypothetical protein
MKTAKTELKVPAQDILFVDRMNVHVSSHLQLQRDLASPPEVWVLETETRGPDPENPNLVLVEVEYAELSGKQEKV